MRRSSTGMNSPVLISRFDWRAKGVPAAGFMLRVTSSEPKRWLKAICVSSSSVRPRKTRMECSSKAARISAHVASSRGRVMSAPSISAAKCGVRRVATMAMAGLRLRGQGIAGLVPGPAAAVDDPDIREAHLLQHGRAQRGLAARPAREENSLASILERGVAAWKLEIGLDVELAASDVPRAWNGPVLGNLPGFAHVDDHRAAAVDDPLGLDRAEHLDVHPGLMHPLSKRLAHASTLPQPGAPLRHDVQDALHPRVAFRTRGRYLLGSELSEVIHGQGGHVPEAEDRDVGGRFPELLADAAPGGRGATARRAALCPVSHPRVRLSQG